MGKTILISSHILTELADCCTSIGIIERGEMLISGPIDEVYRKIRGSRQVEIRFTNGMDVGLSVIRSCEGCQNVLIDGDKVVADIDLDDEGLASVFAELAANRVGISSFYEREPTLEDVFMMVTKGLVS